MISAESVEFGTKCFLDGDDPKRPVVVTGIKRRKDDSGGYKVCSVTVQSMVLVWSRNAHGIESKFVSKFDAPRQKLEIDQFGQIPAMVSIGDE
jgi:hypothetical protein